MKWIVNWDTDDSIDLQQTEFFTLKKAMKSALNPDVAIIGGGIIGLSCAWYLAQEGASVTVVDKGQMGREASWAGAGIIPPASKMDSTHPIDALRSLSYHLFPGLSEDLRSISGMDNGFRICGGLDISEVEGNPEADEEWSNSECVREKWDSSQIREVFPDISSRIEQGYFLPEMAQVRNPWHLRALQAACESRKVRFLTDFSIEKIERKGNLVTGMSSEKGSLSAGKFVITAGAWSGGLLKHLGINLPMDPVRGQIALLQTGNPEGKPNLLMGKRYLVFRGDGLVLSGSTEEKVGFSNRTTPEQINDLIQFGCDILPPLQNATLEKSWAGLRPCTATGMPYIGYVPGLRNLAVASGHFRSGVQLSPGTGYLIAKLLTDKPLPCSMEEFQIPLGLHESASISLD